MAQLLLTTVVFRLSSIGDIVLTSPLLRVLRNAIGPKARLDFVVRKEFADLVRSNHHLSVVHEYDPATGWKGLRELNATLRRERYDLAVDLHDSLRTKYLRACCGARETTVVNKRQYERWQLVHRKRNIYTGIIPVPLRYLETISKFGIGDDGRGLELFVPDSVQSAVSGKMAAAQLHRFECVIGICPGAKHFTKRWQREKYAELGVRAARERGAKILLFGGPAERDDCAYVADSIRTQVCPDCVEDHSGVLSLLETAAAFDFCDVVVTNDSGLMHIAASRQKKIVALFGSTVLEFGFGPFGTEAEVIERKGLECRPCTHIGRASCPLGHFKCMTDIGVDEVAASVSAMLAR
ncbi:MAG TPA: glycosyltransferase family 9 protein [Bacteroidota bacterium]|nr:glycosyltransferase family 9 protein [Bacteroidota bacterium]